MDLVKAMKTAEIANDLRAVTLARLDLSGPRQALRGAGLPADDLDADDVTLYAFEEDGGVVGYGGLEIVGDDALVRSIVVDPVQRRRGFGRQIVEQVLRNAARCGARRAFLLTTDARAYFETLGFAVVDRNDAPPAVLATRQATGLCPVSAVLMVRALAR